MSDEEPGVRLVSIHIYPMKAARAVEDHWRRIRIGAVEFRVVKPCGRCVVRRYWRSPSPLSRRR